MTVYSSEFRILDRQGSVYVVVIAARLLYAGKPGGKLILSGMEASVVGEFVAADWPFWIWIWTREFLFVVRRSR